MRLGATLQFYGAVGAMLACGTAIVRPAELGATNAPGDQMLMTDDFGNLVVVPTNKLSSQFRPPAGISITNQIPSPISCHDGGMNSKRCYAWDTADLY